MNNELNPLGEYIACDTCEYKSYPILKSLEYDFIAKNGLKVYADLRLGWCNTCDKAVMVEYVPSMQELESELRNLEEELAGSVEENQKLREDLENEYGEFDELMYPDKPNDLYPKYSEADYVSAKLQWLKQREAPSKCIECSGTSFIAVKHKEIKLEHPQCGGELNFYIVVMGEAPHYKHEYVSIDGERITNCST